MRLLSTVLGVPGVIAPNPPRVVGVGAERIVEGLRGLAGILSRRAPAVLGGGGGGGGGMLVLSIAARGGNDRGGRRLSFGGGIGGYGWLPSGCASGCTGMGAPLSGAVDGRRLGAAVLLLVDAYISSSASWHSDSVRGMSGRGGE